MKALLCILTFLICLRVEADVSSKHFYFWKKIYLNKTTAVETVVKKLKYPKTKNWVGIIQEMNGLKLSELDSRKKKIVLYLPPKEGEYKKSSGRFIANDDESKCNPITLSRDNSNRVEYLSSRKYYVKSNESIDWYLIRDKFVYRSMSEAVRWVQNANGISSKRLKKGQVIKFPFCPDSSNKRYIASVKSTKNLKPSRFSYSASTQTGVVDVAQGDRDLTMTIFKVGGGVKYKTSRKEKLKFDFSLVKMNDVKHSDAKTTVEINSFYPEFGLGYEKSFKKWSGTFAYNYMNYFVFQNEVQTVDLTLTVLHKISFKPFVPFKKGWGVFGGFGYLKGFDEKSVSGFDATFGLNYNFGKKNNFNVSFLGYMSNLETSVSDDNDTSTAFVGSFSYSF